MQMGYLSPSDRECGMFRFYARLGFFQRLVILNIPRSASYRESRCLGPRCQGIAHSLTQSSLLYYITFHVSILEMYRLSLV